MIGALYQITLSDCCVKGTVYGEFWDFVESDPDQESGEYFFTAPRDPLASLVLVLDADGRGWSAARIEAEPYPPGRAQNATS